MSNISASKKKSDYLPWRDVPSLIKETFKGFFEEKSLFHGAALAYYTVFAMVPLIYLCIVYFGKIIGHKVMLVIIEDLLINEVGIQDVAGIMEFVSQLDFENSNFFMELVSITVLLVASSAFVVCLRHSINDFFDLEINYSSKKKKFVKDILFRAVSLGLLAFSAVVVIFFYFAQTVLISISSDFFNNNETLDHVLSTILRHGLSIVSNALLFTIIFKYVHDGFVKWRLALGGALVTSILLYAGQLLIKYYLFNYFFGSQSGGVAGSLFILLAFVYYSSQIIFFGAKFTAVYAKKIGKPIHFKE